MKKILLTGGNGFIGSNLQPALRQWYQVVAPSRAQLDSKDTDAVYRFVEQGNYDFIIHAANPNPAKNSLDKGPCMLDDSLRSFMNIYKVRDMVQKVFYFGSGAEFDKTQEICMAREQDAQDNMPKDAYGFAKYVMNACAQTSGNIYNLRLFGCYGPGDQESKFITHAVRSCIRQIPITIRQDCLFDYLQVRDVAQVIRHMAEHELKYHDYNVCSGRPVKLSEIAKEVKLQMGMPELPIQILKEGFNHEYTGSALRLKEQMGQGWEPLSLEEGIRIQIRYETEVMGNEKTGGRYPR